MRKSDLVHGDKREGIYFSPVEDCPHGAKDPRRGPQGRLLELHVLLLRLRSYGATMSRQRMRRGNRWRHIGSGMCSRRVPKPTAVPSAMGRRTEAAGLRNTASGMVMLGIKVVILPVRGALCAGNYAWFCLLMENNGRGQGAGGPSGWWWWRALKRGSEKPRVAGVAEL